MCKDFHINEKVFIALGKIYSISSCDFFFRGQEKIITLSMLLCF